MEGPRLVLDLLMFLQVDAIHLTFTSFIHVLYSKYEVLSPGFRVFRDDVIRLSPPLSSYSVCD